MIEDRIEPLFDFEKIGIAAVLASETQVGGTHYTNLSIQPMQYSMANELNALQHTIIKYVTRYQDKGTPLQDLAKAKHCIDMLIEFELEGKCG